jgi:hypothetical protein
MKTLLYIPIFLTFLYCDINFKQRHFGLIQNHVTNEIICDSVYKNKGYKISLRTFDSTSEDETKPNTIFSLYKLTDNRYSLIYKDSIYSDFQDVKFQDFNKDKVKDILIENVSDVRSNLTYNLYIVDTVHDKLKKIKGFNEIKNPNYLPQYNLIDNYVMSGTIWTNFYKIKGNRVKDFGITIYDDQTTDGKYEHAYKKAIDKILAKEKNNR